MGVKDFIDQRNDAFTDREGDYGFLRDAYEGGRVFIEGNLSRHTPRETKADFDRRKAQAVYPNYVRPVLKTYRDHVFKRGEAIRRDVEHDGFNAFLTNVDRGETPANVFWSQVGMREMLYGWMGVLVDMPPLPELERELTVTDTEGTLPYFVAVAPSQIVDWSTDAFGALNWVHLMGEREDDADPMEQREKQEVHRLWTREGWAVYDEEGNLIAEGEHHLGEVPFVFVRYEPSEVWPMIGSSFMDDFSRMGKAIMNSMSLRHDFLAKNSMQLLTLQLTPLSDDGGGEEEIVIRNLLEIPIDATMAPQFIGPDVSGAEFMFRHADDLREQMFYIAMLQSPERPQAAEAGESGIAKMIDFEQTNAALTSFADSLEEAETHAARLWFLWQGIEWNPDWEIDYPDQFNIRSLADDLLMTLQVRDSFGDASPTFVAEWLKIIAQRLIEQLPEEVRMTVEDELDENLQNLTQDAMLGGRTQREIEDSEL